MSEIDEKRLAEDLARLDRIEAEAREAYGDQQLRLEDVVCIHDAAVVHGVTRQVAYRRAKELGLLSYQQDALTPPSPKDE